MGVIGCSFLLYVLMAESCALNIDGKRTVKYIWSPIVQHFREGNLSQNLYGLPQNVEPSYYGYSFELLCETNATSRFVIGSPKSIDPSNSSLHLHTQLEEEIDYHGTIETCGPVTTDWFSNGSAPGCDSGYPAVLRPGDHFGVEVAAAPDGDILACSPTREQICGDLSYTPGLCYKSNDSGNTWQGEGTTKNLSCPTTPTVDVLFVLDGSGSVGNDSFDTVKDWVKNITKILDISKKTTSVGVVQYSHYYEIQPLNKQKYIVTHIKIGQYSNYDEFAEVVDKIRLQGYTTYTGHALQKVAFDFKESKNFKKSKNKQVMILLTDGAADDEEIVLDSAQALRDLGVITFAVGVGEYQYFLKQLRNIANGNTSDDTRVLTVNDFEGLGDVANTLQVEIQSIALEGGGFDLQNKEIGLAASYSKPASKRCTSDKEVSICVKSKSWAFVGAWYVRMRMSALRMMIAMRAVEIISRRK